MRTQVCAGEKLVYRRQIGVAYLQYDRTINSFAVKSMNQVLFQGSMMLNELNWADDGSLSAPMEPAFAAFRGAFGGWTAAHAVLAAARQSQPGMEPVSLSIDFLQGIEPGMVTSVAQAIHQTRSTSFMSVNTLQGGKLCAHSSVVMSKRRDTARAEGVQMPQCTAPEDTPALRIDPGPNTWVSSLDMRCAQGKLLHANPMMRSLTWTRMQDAPANPHATLAALADASIPRIFYHFNEVSPIATITMSVHFHCSATDMAQQLEDFVLIEASGQVAAEGFFDQQVRIWSRSGRLLGTSTQLVRYDIAPAP
jgi:acyl-CoA thioesterase